jgi:hypothetical protein
MTSVVVAGYMLRHPAAGNVLAYFQYVLGLHRLGHEVTYVEESGWPYSSYDIDSGHWVQHPASGLRTVRALVGRHCPGVRVIWVDRDSGRVDGASREELGDVLASADLLLNVGGVCWLPDFALCRRRALVDMDPFFSQVGGFASTVLGDYHAHFSYGTNIGRAGCTVPTLGFGWQPTLPPVVVDLWGSDAEVGHAPYTTVANWTGYGGVEYQGEHYGQKDEEFAHLVGLPAQVPARLELALAGGREAFPVLREHGWSVRDAGPLSSDVGTYVGYVTGSRGELSAAKNAYVKTRSGWFSDRTACYLAAGRPAIVQDTGCRAVPSGHGLLLFDDPTGAARSLRSVERDYADHAAAARAVACDVLAHDVVLPELLDRALAPLVVGGPS